MLEEFITINRRIEDNVANSRELTADIRQLAIENQRILRYLESLVNKP